LHRIKEIQRLTLVDELMGGTNSRGCQQAQLAERPLLLEEDDVSPDQTLLKYAINPHVDGGSLQGKERRGRGRRTDIESEDGVVVQAEAHIVFS
jgi:hypothetical protein